MGLHVIGNGNSPLNAWRNQYWPGIIDMNVIGNAANPTKDGYPNLMKYALGADPTKANGNLTEIGTVNIGGTSYLTLTYVGRTDDPTLSFTVLAGNSLLSSGTWTALDTATSNGTTLSGGSHEVAANQSDVLNGFLRVTVRDSLPIDVNAPPRRYLRLEVQTTNP